ncbi:pX69R [African swine fever virus]|uniref:PX69R n=1 Tax=African swine fever virus TaxID=10497 RepID=A0A2Z5DFP1_ASF|nr:pX69R [African swine fever virus]
MLLLYTVMILTCIIYKLVPDNKYGPIHMFFFIIVYIVYMYEKLDIHEKSQFWNHTMARLSGCPVPTIICNC